MNKTLKQFLPHVIILLLFVLISFIYFYPVLQGKEMSQMDYSHAIGITHETLQYFDKTGESALWTNAMFGGMPTYQISGPKYFNFFQKLHYYLQFQLPYTTVAILFTYLFCFYILLLSLKVDKWLSFIGSTAFALSSYNIIIIAAGHITKTYAIAFMAPVIAGVLVTYNKKYILGGIFTTIALGLEIVSNHPQITYYLALIVGLLVLFKLIMAIIEKEIKHFTIATTILVGAAVLSLLPNITMLWTTYEYGKYSIRGESEITNTETKKNTGLDKEYALAWSYGVDETLTLLIPNAKGGGTSAIYENQDAMKNVSNDYKEAVGQQNQYWGDQPFTSGPVYFGAIIMFLFVLGMFIIPNKIKWWILAATLLSIALSWGKNFELLTNFFFYNMPLYNKFRTVSMTLVLASLTVPLLSILTVKEIIDNPDILKQKQTLYKFLAALGLTAGVSLILWLMPNIINYVSAQELSYFDGLKSQSSEYAAQINAFLIDLEAARKTIFKADAIRSFAFILLGAATIYIYNIGKFNKFVFAGILSLIGITIIYVYKDSSSLKFILLSVLGFISLATYLFKFLAKNLKYAFLTVIGLLMVTDMWIVDRRYLSADDFKTQKVMDTEFKASNADKVILKDVDPNFRVLDLTKSVFNDGFTPYFHKSIGGYHGAKLRRYQDLIDYYLGPSIQLITETLKTDTTGVEFEKVVSNLHVLNMLNPKYFIINSETFPYTNFNAFGNAWFVDKFVLVDNADDELKKIGDLNPRRNAIINKTIYSNYVANLPQLELASTDTGKIELLTYSPNKLVYKSKSSKTEFAVFSEIYYPKGWNAFIDGQKVEHVCVNYILRGLIVPAGSHEIEFVFEPDSYYTGKKISLISSIFIILLTVGGLVWMFLNKKKTANFFENEKTVEVKEITEVEKTTPLLDKKKDNKK